MTRSNEHGRTKRHKQRQWRGVRLNDGLGNKGREMGLFNCMKCFPKLCRCPEKHAWGTIGGRKANIMLEQGLEPIGAMLLDPKTGKRATVDIFGRVQWWEVDGAGALVPNAAKSRQGKKGNK